jgi:hypothetical protein
MQPPLQVTPLLIAEAEDTGLAAEKSQVDVALTRVVANTYQP